MAASNEQAAQAVSAQDSIVEVNDELVREYLKIHDDFLQRHPDMLDYLHVSHASGSAVSLVEKQVSVLRERNMDMRHRLNTLTTNARHNDRLFEQTRNLVLELMDARSTGELYSAFMSAMSANFEVEYAAMILYGEAADGDWRAETRERTDLEIGSLFKGDKPVSGTLRKEELQFLFPECEEAGSAAIVPLARGDELGLVAVGSSDANRYSNAVGTLFLSHIADVIARLLPDLHTRAS